MRQYRANSLRNGVETMIDKERITKIVAASLLADGSVGIPPDGSINAKYRQSKTIEHQDYIDWLADILSGVTLTNSYEFQPKISGAKRQVMLQTRCVPFYTKFRNRMYPNGFKVVEPHYLKLVDWEFLAVMFQEDGYAYLNEDKYIRVVLCTETFSYGDNQTLRLAFKDKLGIDFSVKSYRSKGRQMYRLHLNKKCINVFMEGVEPYMCESFKYKIYRAVSPETSLVLR